MTPKEVQGLVYLTLKRNLDIAREQGVCIEVTISEQKHALVRFEDLHSIFASVAANVAQSLIGEHVRG